MRQQDLELHWNGVGGQKEHRGGASAAVTMIMQLGNSKVELVEEEEEEEEELAVSMTVCISEAREEIVKEWLTAQRERSHERVSCCQLIGKCKHRT